MSTTTLEQQSPDTAVLASPSSFDPGKLQDFMHRMVGEAGAVFSAPLVVLGDKLGFYRALDGAGGLTSTELAERTGTHERYVREWLNNQAAGGIVTYDPETDRYTLPHEHAAVFVEDKGPAYIPSMFGVLVTALRNEDRLLEAFRTGKGIGWHEHDDSLFCGTEKFFKPGYRMSLVNEWIPALDGVQDKLRRGAVVADIGCGHGASTILMAQAYPASTFVGFDYHEASIRQAQERAREAEVADRVTFEAASAKEFPGRDYDLVTVFDALHDMGDPAGAAAHVRQSLAKDGTWMIVEPYAGDRVEDNLSPIGRIFYAASTVVCTPASKSQEVGLALGAQAGEARIREVVTQGGFTRFRRATETPFNLVFEARP